MIALRRRTVSAVLVALSGLTLASLAVAAPASAAPVVAQADDGGVREWTQVPAEVARTQTVWAPTDTLGLELHSTTDIAIQRCVGAKGYVVSALYGGGTAVEYEPSFAITESPGCEDSGYSFYGPVRTFRTAYGSFTVFGECGWNAAKGAPVKGYNGGPCPASSVKSKGGLIIYTQSRPTKAGLPTTTVVTSDGLTYGQLVALGKGLRPLR